MNWQRIHDQLEQRAEQEADLRALKLKRRVRKHMKRLITLRSRRGVYVGGGRYVPSVPETPQWRTIRDALDRGSKILAFDAEWTMRRPITELGIAIYQNGEMTAHNVRLTPGGKNFRYGVTRYMTDRQAKLWVRGMFSEADLLVGHALNNDRLQMRRWGEPIPDMPYLDTSPWSRALNQSSHDPISLGKFADRYGVDCTGAHCGGNDAVITLNLVLALARIEVDNICAA